MHPLLELALGLALVVTPLLLAALGEWVVEKSGVINVAVEGAMLVACFLAYFVTIQTGSPWVGVLAAAGGGASFALLLGVAHVLLRADAVVVGTALNLLALGATGLAMQALSRQGSVPVAEPLTPLALSGVAVVLVIGAAWLVNRTAIGLRLRACGEDPVAARLLGVPVERIRLSAVLVGGLLAGLAGAQLCLVEARTFVEGMTAGRGFLALAIVVCGRYRALGVAIAAIVFGGAILIQFRVQATGSLVPYPIFLMFPYLATLLVLALLAGRARAPASLGAG